MEEVAEYRHFCVVLFRCVDFFSDEREGREMREVFRAAANRTFVLITEDEETPINYHVTFIFFFFTIRFRQYAYSAFIPPDIISLVFLSIFSLSLYIPIVVWPIVLVTFFLGVFVTSFYTFLFFHLHCTLQIHPSFPRFLYGQALCTL